MSLTFEALRTANTTRHVRYYDPSGPRFGHDDWLVALAGEVGEACNVVKKINRHRLGMSGNGSTLGGLAELRDLVLRLGAELADVTIYLDIVASHFQSARLLERSSVGVADFDGLRQLTMAAFGGIPGARLDLLSRQARSMFRIAGVLLDVPPSSDAEFALLGDALLGAVDALAAMAGIDLGAAVARTFNATSEKLGFPERLTEWWDEE